MPPEIKIEDIGSHVIFSFRIRTIFRSMRNIQVEQILFAILLELPITDGGQQSTLLFLTNIIGIPHYISCYRATHIQYPIIANHRWTSARLETIANTLETGKTLFVKPGLSNVFIRIEGKLIADDTKIFSTSSQIRESEETSITAATKNYSVQYSLANTQGTLTLTINVNGTVEIVEIPVEVNPYE